MAIPKPEAGLVIRYSFLWQQEAEMGREEGRKDRPCAIVAAVAREDDGRYRVAVVPITHTPPKDLREAIEIPPNVAKSLGLDWARSWIVTGETNKFTWPGPDIRAAQGENYVFGKLPYKLAEQARAAVFDVSRRHRAIERDEQRKPRSLARSRERDTDRERE